MGHGGRPLVPCYFVERDGFRAPGDAGGVMATQVWDVGSEQGFMACYRASLSEVFRYAAMLCGSDRALV